MQANITANQIYFSTLPNFVGEMVFVLKNHIESKNECMTINGISWGTPLMTLDQGKHHALCAMPKGGRWENSCFLKQ